MKHNQAPVRKHQVGVLLGADSWEDLVDGLHEIARKADERRDDERPALMSVSGGPTYGYTAISTTNELQTHQRYFEQLHVYLERRRKEEAGELEPEPDPATGFLAWLEEQYQYYEIGATTTIAESAHGKAVIRDVAKKFRQLYDVPADLKAAGASDEIMGGERTGFAAPGVEEGVDHGQE